MMLSHADARLAWLNPRPCFEGPDGAVSLRELLGDRDRLVLYHFKFAPSVADMPSTACPGCTMYIDNIDRAALTQLANRDAAFAIVSHAPIEALQAYKKRMSWKHTWVASADASDTHGISVFSRDGGNISRRFFAISRGLERVGAIWSVLDLPSDRPRAQREEWSRPYQ